MEQEETQLAVTGALRKHFGIANLYRLPTTGWNFTFRGEGSRPPLFVKVLRPGPDGKINRAVETGARVAHTLAASGMLGVIAPLPNADGELLTRAADEYIVTYPWIECVAPNSRTLDEKLVPAARLLAHLHVALARIDDSRPDQQLDPCQVSPFSHSPEIWLRHAGHLFASAKARLHATPSMVDLLSRAEAAALCLAASDAQLFSSAKGSQLLHGDYRDDNLLRTLDGCKIIDFDMCHTGEVCEDLAYGALAFAGGKWMVGARDCDRIVQFVQAYNLERQSLDVPEAPVDKLSPVLKWTVLKAMSLSYKAEQVVGRWCALQSLSALA